MLLLAVCFTAVCSSGQAAVDVASAGAARCLIITQAGATQAERYAAETHGLEAAGDYVALRHGEAVSLGMVAALVAREVDMVAPANQGGAPKRP